MTKDIFRPLPSFPLTSEKWRVENGSIPKNTNNLDLY